MYENVLVNSDRWFSNEDLLNEIWKDYTYEGKTYYKVSNYGRCKSITRTRLLFNGVPCVQVGKIIKASKDNKGYYSYHLSYDGKRVVQRVHRLVALCFIPNPDNLPFINHKDENPSNNRVDNLEWCSHEYNINYGTRTERARKSASKSIEQFDLDGNYIKTWESLAEASKTLNISRGTLCSCLKGSIKSCGGYQWKYSDSNDKIEKYSIEHPVRRIVQLDLDGNFINIYDNLHDAERKTGVWITQIRKCCDKIPMYKTAKGYKWCWEDDYIGK